MPSLFNNRSEQADPNPKSQQSCPVHVHVLLISFINFSSHDKLQKVNGCFLVNFHVVACRNNLPLISDSPLPTTFRVTAAEHAYSTRCKTTARNFRYALLDFEPSVLSLSDYRIREFDLHLLYI